MPARHAMSSARGGRLTQSVFVIFAAIAIAGIAVLVLAMELGKPTSVQQQVPRESLAGDMRVSQPLAPVNGESKPELPLAADVESQPEETASAIHTPYHVAAGRSPIPQPGETFDKPIAPVRLVAQEAGPIEPITPAPAEGEILPWEKAALHMGRVITIRGKVVQTRNIGRFVFLNFEPYPNDLFYVVVYQKTYADFPQPPEQYFLGQVIEVTGEVKRHKNRPQIQVHEADKIRRVDDAPTGIEAS